MVLYERIRLQTHDQILSIGKAIRWTFSWSTRWRTHKIIPHRSPPTGDQSGNVNVKDVGLEYITEIMPLEAVLYIRIIAYFI